MAAGYSLAPNPRAYDPSAMEQIYGKAISDQMTPDNMLGFLIGAEADRQAASNRYQEDYRLGVGSQLAGIKAKAASDLQGDRYKLLGALVANPQQAALFSDTAALVAPEMRDRADQLSQANLGVEQGTAVQRAGAGAFDLAKAGVFAPPGSTYTPLGLPTQTRTQGTPLSLMEESMKARTAAAGAGGMKDTALNTMQQLFDQIGTEHSKELVEIERAAQDSVQQKYDNMGRPLGRAKTQAEADAWAEAQRAQSRQRAEQRYASMSRGYTLGGRAGVVPPSSLAPQSAPTVRPAEVVQPQPGGKSNTAGGADNNRAAPPPPANNAARIESMRTILARNGAADAAGMAARLDTNKPAGAVRGTFDHQKGTFTYLDAQNKPLQTVPYR